MPPIIMIIPARCEVNVSTGWLGLAVVLLKAIVVVVGVYTAMVAAFFEVASMLFMTFG